MPNQLTLENLTIDNGPFDPGLKGINLCVSTGELVVVSGRSGHCKSTLLELCAGLKRPHSGRVLWGDTALGSVSREELFELRQQLGFQFQQHALISNLPLFENLALPLRYRGGMTEEEIGGRVRHYLDLCGLYNLDRRFPERLSCGELRRASLARALVNEPGLLLLDEPTAGVDLVAEHGIINIIREVRRLRTVAILMVSNSLQLVRELDCRVVILDAGVMVTLDEALKLPGDRVPYSAPFLKDAYEEGRKQRST